MNGSYDVEINRFVKRVSYSGNLRSVANGPVFRHSVCRTETYQSSFFNRTVDLWNVLPSNIRTCTPLESFKRNLKNYYRDKLAAAFDPDEICNWSTICRCCMCSSLWDVLFVPFNSDLICFN